MLSTSSSQANRTWANRVLGGSFSGAHDFKAEDSTGVDVRLSGSAPKNGIGQAGPEILATAYTYSDSCKGQRESYQWCHSTNACPSVQICHTTTHCPGQIIK